MNNDFDLERLGDIPDPFADVSVKTTRRLPTPPAYDSPTRTRVRGLRAACLGAAIAYEALGILALKTRPDLSSLAGPTLALNLMIPAAGAAIGLGAATRAGDRGLGYSVGRLFALTMGALLLFTFATLLASPQLRDDSFWQHALSCILTSAILGAGPLVFGAWAMRRAFVTAARWRAAALGIACGGLAAATLSLVCPNGSAFHILVGHGTMMVLMAAAGALAGRRIAGA